MKTQPDPDTSSDATSAPAIEASGITKTYRQGAQEVRALHGVDVVVQRGEFVAVTGASGSGKSTLLHILGGLDRPDGGTVLLEGKDILSLSDEELAVLRRRRLGFVL
ncbi:MAG: ATP-binding cassette domain-containing protein, partial [Actinomycetota bacterium]